MTVDYPMYRKAHNITFEPAIEKMRVYVRDTTFQQCYCPRLLRLFCFLTTKFIPHHIAHRRIIPITRNKLILLFSPRDDHEHFLKKIPILERIYQYG